MRTNQNVRGIIIREGKILLIHRFKEGREYWVIPGGGVEEGESLETALKREMIEETGLKIISFELVKTIGEQYIYTCVLSDGEVVLGGPEDKDNSEANKYILTWVPIDEAKKIEVLYPIEAKDLI
jgi:ADP-ribose pyrophosphatase YjhB (NUDIX family)